jgi:hypothetical protein
VPASSLPPWSTSATTIAGGGSGWARVEWGWARAVQKYCGADRSASQYLSSSLKIELPFLKIDFRFPQMHLVTFNIHALPFITCKEQRRCHLHYLGYLLILSCMQLLTYFRVSNENYKGQVEFN